MNRWMKHILPLALMMAHALPVLAADIDLTNPPEVKITTSPKHWYLNSYVGTDISVSTSYSRLGIKHEGENTGKRMGRTGDGFLTGVGIGYRVNDLLRLDTNFEYRAQRTLKAKEWSDFGSTSYNGDLTSYVFMTNAYLDLGTFRSITPYVGAGAGLSLNRIDNTQILTRYGPAGVANRRDWQFAWALHAGVGIELNDNLTLDVGYSYTDLGNIHATRTQTGSRFIFKGLHSHDIKIGLRYAFH